jgi:integrase
MTVPIGIFRRHKVYWFRLIVNGRKIRRPGGATPEEAVAARERAAAELGAAPKPPPGAPATTVRRLADAYLDHLRVTAKPQSVRSADYALRKINARLGSVLARKLTAGVVDRFVAARLREVGKAEVNKELRLLRAALRFAVDRGMLDTIPVRVKMLKTPRKTPTILAPEEVGRLLSAAGSLRPLLMVAAYTGLRSGELCALRHRDVDACPRGPHWGGCARSRLRPMASNA